MDYPLRTLVAGLATLDSQDPVLRYGIQVAETVGATLHVVLAFPVAAEFASLSSGLGTPSAPMALDLQTRLLASLQELVNGRSRARIECHAVPGAAHAALARMVEALGADMVLVGATRKGRLGRTLLGTTSSRLTRSVTVPLLVLREPLPPTGARVLLATDLSELSARTYRCGIDVAQALFPSGGLEMRSLLVARQEFGYMLPPMDEERLRTTATADHRRFLDQHGLDGAVLEAQVRIGEPADEIVSLAEEWPADVVVLGTHGRTGLSRTFLGSVAESTLRNLSCNALVIPSARFAEPDGTQGPP